MAASDLMIKTERLILKRLTADYAERFFGYRAFPDVGKYQNFKPKTLDDAYDFIKKIANAPNIPNTWYQLGIFTAENNELIGDIGVHFIDDDNSQTEIGYTLSPDYQSKGYASEAVKSVLEYLFTALGKHRVTASVDPHNVKSAGLLERLNFRKEAHFVKSFWFSGEWADEDIYAILSEEYLRNID